jgi:hypothetical protein
MNREDFQTLLARYAASEDLASRRLAFQALALHVAQTAQDVAQDPASGAGNRAEARRIARAAQTHARAVCYTQTK